MSHARLLLLFTALICSLGAVKLSHHSEKGWFDIAWIRNPLADLWNLPYSPQALAFGLSLLLWREGIRLGSKGYTRREIEFRFSIGLLCIALSSFFARWLGWEVELLPFAISFFLSSLSVLSLMGALESGEKLLWSRGAFTLISMMAVALLALVITGLLLRLNPISLLASLLPPLLRLIEFFLLLLFYLLGYLAWLLTNLIPSLPWRGSEVEIPPLPRFDEVLREMRSIHKWPPWVGSLFRGVFITALAAFFLRMLFKAFGHAEAPLGQETWESRESVASLAELRRWWEALFTKLRKRLEKTSERGYAPAELLRKPSSALAIRMIYRELLRLMAEFGFSRRPWETPYEYLRVLEEAFPSVKIELGFITEAYVMARYGADFPSDMLMEVRRNWEKAIEVFSGWHENGR
jgi:hypothetical protein